MGAPESNADVWAEGAENVDGACAFIGCKRSTLFDLMARGDVVWTNLGGKAGARRVVSRKSLRAYLNRCAGGGA